MFKNFTILIFLILITIFSTAKSCPYGQYYQFYQKELINKFPIISNPYHKPTQQYLNKVNQNLHNKQRVCALKYQNPPNKERYWLKTFDNKASAQNQGWIVTHQGICGACSTTKDLFIYLSTDLTRPVRKCGVKHPRSHHKLRQCIKSLGFTDACTQVWLWNTLNTKKNCFLVCMWALLTNEAFVINGQLNKCLQCDQDISGPIFKYQSGRTRRNSGIHSQIDRPRDQIYNMTHCYY